MAEPMLEIDYSGIVEDVPAAQNSWRPPRHVYFGKRNPESGQMDEEPIYSHKPYPAYFYKMKDGKIVPRIVRSDEELAAVKADGWFDTPAKLGYIGAPSFEEVQKMRSAMEAPEETPKMNAKSRKKAEDAQGTAHLDTV